jgi:DNA repair protein RadC
VRRLSTTELLALVAGEKATAYGDDIRSIAMDGPTAIARRCGLGPVAARRLAASIELGARIASQGNTAARPILRTAIDCARYLLPRHSTHPVEVFGAVLLDVRCRLKQEIIVSTGCLTSSLVHPRELFQPALLHRAAALIVFHNHPSGDPEPSREDEDLTRRVAEAGKLIGVAVLDHIILGDGSFVSLKERGRM